MPLKKIAVIQTGGTIDKDYPKSRLGYAFEIGEAAAPKILQRGRIDAEINVVPVCRKDSQDISENDRRQIAETCLSVSEDKILVTHGTDTLMETALYLASYDVICSSKTVVLTGAFKPETFKDSDADFNIGVAVGALQTLVTPGVYVSMNGHVMNACEATRDADTGNFVKKSKD